MSNKKETTKDALNDLLNNPVSEKSINALNNVDKDNLNKLKKEAEEQIKQLAYKVVSIRMSEQDKILLTSHFKRKGIINFSTGIRKIIADYMESEGLS